MTTVGAVPLLTRVDRLLSRLEQSAGPRRARSAADARTAPRVTPIQIFQAAGLTPEPWQYAVLSERRDRVVVAHRQAGKTLLSASEAVAAAISYPRQPVLVVSPSERQSRLVIEAAQVLLAGLGILGRRAVVANELSVKFPNRSRIIALPGKAKTTRGYSSVSLVIYDEAAYITDTLYHTLRPVLARSKGRKLAVSTPAGKRGWFSELWHSEGVEWARFNYPVEATGALDAEYLAKERAEMPARWYAQEYECAWLNPEDSLLRAEDVAAAFADNVEPMFNVARTKSRSVFTDEVQPLAV